MYQNHRSTIYSMKEQRFNEKFPLSIVATLAVAQMLVTSAIFALEVGHNILHMKLTNLFVGFWVAIPFTVLWISMFAVVCCCRRKSCATHAVVQNILGLIFACILIGINTMFIHEPNKCYFTEGICHSLSWTSYISDPIECMVDGLSTGCGSTRMTIIIAQLAAGVLMAICCLIYLIVYMTISFQVSKANRCPIATAGEAVMAPVYPTNPKAMPMTVSHHHQTCTISSQPYEGAVPVMMAVYPPQAPPDANFINYVSANQYATMYPQITHERF